MNILKSGKEIGKRELARLATGHAVSLKEAPKDTPLTVDNYCQFEDLDNRTGETKSVLAVQLSGKWYATVSDTFQRSFSGLVQAMGLEEPWEIKVIEGLSRSNRSYLDCEIVD